MGRELYTRLVSQDGLAEVPYERCNIYLETKTSIFASFEGEHFLMGVYSTPEEAQKVLKDLRSPEEYHDGYFYFPKKQEHVTEEKNCKTEKALEKGVIEVRGKVSDIKELADVLQNNGYEIGRVLGADDSRVTYWRKAD